MLAAFVALVVVAVVVNVVRDARGASRVKRDTAVFRSYLAGHGGARGFGRPRASLGARIATVCATHRGGQRFRFCLELAGAGRPRVERAYEVGRVQAHTVRRPMPLGAQPAPIRMFQRIATK